MNIEKMRLAVARVTLAAKDFRESLQSLSKQMTEVAGAGSEFMDELAKLVKAHPELVAPETCPRCHQRDVGQQGEYPCEECGLPTCWGVADGLTKDQEDLVHEMHAREKAEEGEAPGGFMQATQLSCPECNGSGFESGNRDDLAGRPCSHCEGTRCVLNKRADAQDEAEEG